MNPELDLPRRLQGPIGLSQIFCLVRSEPMLGKVPRRRGLWIVVALVSSGIGLLEWGFFRRERSDLGGLLGELAIALWLLGEFVGSAFGAGLAMGQVRRWRVAQRLPELTLTGIRPLAIGQMILYPLLGPGTMIVAISYALFALFLLSSHSDEGLSLVHYGAIAANLIASYSTGAWVGLALTLGLRHRAAAILGCARTCLILALPSVFLFCVLAAYDIFPDWPYSSRLERKQLGMAAVMSLAIALGVAVKLLLARAYAARLEEVIFPRMEF